MFFALSDLKSTIIQHPLVISPRATVSDAIAKLNQECTCDFGAQFNSEESQGHNREADCVLVVDGRHVKGWVAKQALIAHSHPHQSSDDLTMRELMTPAAVILRESALDAVSVVHLLQQPSIFCLPVVDDGDRLVGLITPASLLRAFSVEQSVDSSRASTRLESNVAAEKTEQPDSYQRANSTLDPYLDTKEPHQHAEELSQENIERHISEKVCEQTATLKESEERWALAIEGTNDGIWDHDLVSGEHFLSPRCMEIVGYDYAEIDSFEKWIDFIHPDDQKHVQTTFVAYLQNKKSTYVCEYRVKCKDGRYKWLLSRGKALWDKSGNPIRAIGSITDISDRKQAEELLRQSEARYRAIVQEQTELIARLQPDGTLTFVNDAFCRYFGLAESEVVGYSYKFNVYPEDQSLVEDCFAALSPSKPVDIIEHRIRVSGGVRWMQWVNHAIYDFRGNLVELQSVGRDIHERKQIEIALAHTTQQLQAFLDNAPAVIGLFDSDGRYLRVNPALANLFGLPIEKIVGKTFADLFPSALVRLFKTRMERLAETQVPLEVEDELEVAGDTRIMRSLLFPVVSDAQHCNQGETNQSKAKQGKISPTAFWSIATDITERKRIKNALQKKTDELQKKTAELDRFFSVALDLLCIADTDGYFLRLNSQWEKTLGYSLNELEGARFLDYVHPDDLKSTLDILTALEQQRDVHNFVNRYRCQNGDYRWIEWRATPVGQYVYAAARDITDRQEAEFFLRKSEERFVTVFNSNPSPGWITSLEGRFLEVNESFSRFYGDSPKNLVGRTCTDLRLWNDPEDQISFQQTLRTTQRLPSFEVVWRTRSGQPRTVLISANVSWINDEECIIGVLNDISDRKQTELKVQKAQQNAELASQAKSAFIAYMKHELRSPLNSILNFARQLKRDRRLLKGQQERAGTIEQSAKNLLNAINQVLDVAEFDYPQCHLNLRYRYVNGDRPNSEEQLVQALAQLPNDLLTQLEEKLYLGEPHQIINLVATIKADDVAIGLIIAEKVSNFQYSLLLKSIEKVRSQH